MQAVGIEGVSNEVHIGVEVLGSSFSVASPTAVVLAVIEEVVGPSCASAPSPGVGT